MLFFKRGEANGLARAHDVPERILDVDGSPLSAWLRCAGVFAFTVPTIAGLIPLVFVGHMVSRDCASQLRPT